MIKIIEKLKRECDSVEDMGDIFGDIGEFVGSSLI